MRRGDPGADTNLFGSFSPVGTCGVGHEALVIFRSGTAGPRHGWQNGGTVSCWDDEAL